MSFTRTLVLAAGTFLVSASAHAESSSVYIDQVPPSLSDGKLESDIAIRTNETQPSDSPLNLDFRLTNTPQPGASGGGNTSIIRQSGNENQATVDVQGSGNATRQIQNGNHNSSEVTIVNGNRNSVAVTQEGDGHRSIVDLAGTDGQEVIHIQRGNDKFARTRHSGSATDRPIVIRQN